MWGEKMKINLYNHDYLITSTTVVNGVVYLLLQDLQDPAHKMYRKDIESVVLYLYEMQAKTLINLPTREEYQIKIESLSTSLKENDVYRYLERLVPNMNIPQEKAAEILGMRTQALYTMIHRAKKWIRKKYGAEYEEMNRKG